MKFPRRTLFVWGLVNLGGSSLGARAKSGERDERIDEWRSVSEFGADATGRMLSNSAFEACLKVTKKVHVPPGVFKLGGGGVDCPSDTQFSGVGDASIIEAADAATRQLFHVDSGSRDARNNVDNISFRLLRLRGLVDKLGFSEHRHLMRLSGVGNVKIDNVEFEGFRGDGLYIGSGDIPGVERHNRSVTVRNCRFDGVNNDNRNGITVIDCDGFRVEECEFQNCTRNNMPGAIDFEPNGFAWHVLRNVVVKNNKFRGNGGTGGSITFYFPDIEYAAPPSGFLIEGNVIDGSAGRENGIVLHHAGAATPSRSPHVFVVRENIIKDSAHGFKLFGVRDVRFDNNSMVNISNGCLVGVGGDKAVKDISLVRNRFQKNSSDDLRSRDEIIFGDVDGLSVIDNSFVWEGRRAAIDGSLLNFLRGKIKQVMIEGNKYKGASPPSAKAIRLSEDHLVEKRDFSIGQGNDWGGLASDL